MIPSRQGAALRAENNPSPAGGPPRGPHGPGGPGGPRGGFGKPKDLKGTALRTVKYIAARPVLLVAALLCVAAEAVLSVWATYVQKPIIDGLADAVRAGQADWPGLVTNCLYLVGIYLLVAVALYIEANLMAQLAQRGCNKLRRELFDRLQQLPLGPL